MRARSTAQREKISSYKPELYCLLNRGIDKMLIVTSPRPRGLDCDRSDGVAGAVRDRSFAALRDPKSASARARLIVIGQAPDCGRSGAAGDAVRGRSLDLSPRPAAALQPVRLALPAPLSLSTLTPARWQSKSLVVQSRGANGPGGAVPNGTSPELARNFQAIETAAFFAQFHGSALAPRVHVRGRVYASVRAHVRGAFSGTPEPTNIIVIEHRVIGSKSGSAQFQFGTADRAALSFGGFPSVINILAVGYSSAVDQDRSSTVIRGRGGETFGLGVAGSASTWAIEGLGLVDQVRLTRRSENGGIPPFLGAPTGRVGRGMLEGRAQGVGIAALSCPRRLPVRLTRAALVEGPRGSRRASAPPLAPIAPSVLPSTLAHERGQIWIGSAIRIRGLEHSAASRCQTGRRATGSGWGSADPKTRATTTGRGIGGVVRDCPRRNAHGRTGGAGVN